VASAQRTIRPPTYLELMASTPWAAFNEFKSNIALTTSQWQVIRERRDTVHSYLRSIFSNASDMPLIRTKLIGSAGRRTMIRPPDDLDVLAIFDPSSVWASYQFDSAAFLYRIRNALADHTTVRVVGARGQAVRLFYASGAQVDVAPVFARAGGGYWLPDGSGGWLATDPDYHDSWSASRNGELSDQMKPMTRMLKAWNRAHSQRLKGFHLEVMVSSVFASMGSNSRENSKLFFAHAPYYLHVQDPAGHGGDLGGRLTLVQEAAVDSSLRSASERAEAASAAEVRGDHAEAIRLWKIIYGSEFPSYSLSS
jgi:hypothetical protein